VPDVELGESFAFALGCECEQRRIGEAAMRALTPHPASRTNCPAS
jgi:hypothetical protein